MENTEIKCSECGTKLQKKMKYCWECGKKIHLQENESIERLLHKLNRDVKLSYLNPNSANLDNFIFVEGGTFIMGNGGEYTPKHTVTLSSFYMCNHLLTQSEYAEICKSFKIIVGNEPYMLSGDYLYSSVEICNKLSRKHRYVPCYDINREKKEITCNWNANGYRLPSEAEWEYAARGGNKSKKFRFSGSNKLIDVGWGRDECSSPRPVCLKLPNELGIYDMSGNVFELCFDTGKLYSEDEQNDPRELVITTEQESKLIVRGGDYKYSTKNCTVYARLGWGDDKAVGIRLVRSCL